jgi:hypothetical protein
METWLNGNVSQPGMITCLSVFPPESDGMVTKPDSGWLDRADNVVRDCI